MIAQQTPVPMISKTPVQISTLVHMRSNALAGVYVMTLPEQPDKPRGVVDFRQMVNRLCGEVSLLLALPDGPEHARQTVAEFWRNVASLKDFFGINSGISQIVSMLRTARFCWMERTSSRAILEVISNCLQAIASRKEPYTDEFADEIGDRLEEAGVDLNAVDILKPSLKA